MPVPSERLPFGGNYQRVVGIQVTERKVLILLTMGLLLGSALPSRAAETASRAVRLLSTNRPLVIGHRGYSAVAPENTLPSFSLALAAGVDMVELDYHHSKEGIPIVIHDATLDRTTDAKSRWPGSGMRVEDRTVAELSSLDAGKWYAASYASARLPKLVEALDLIQGRGVVTLIERKGGDAKTCVDLLRQRGGVNEVVVQSFDWDYLRQFHALEPTQILGALGPAASRDGKKLSEADKALNATWIAEIKTTGARVVGWNRQVSHESVQLAHEAGLKVLIYTINEPALANSLLDMGVDGLISDNPALIWKTLALRGVSVAR